MRKEWELKKIGECFSYIKNGANIKQTKGAGGYPITRIETLSGGVFNRDRLGYADVVDLEQYKDYILESGDLLVSHINSKTYIGRTVVYEGKQGENIIHGMNLLRLKHNRSLINSAFLCYYTQSVSFKLDIMRIRKDAVNQSSFAISDFKKIRIPVPVLATQLSIVSELDKINELIRIKKEQLKDYDTLAQSIFYEMFGDPVVNEKGWEVKTLGDICEITSSKRVFANEYVDTGVPFYRSKEVIEKSKQLPISVELYISESHYNKIKSSFGVPQIGDILVTAVGTVGKIWVVDTNEPFYFKDGNLVWLRNIKGAHCEYFRYSLFYLIDEYKKVNANGAAYNALTIAKLKLMLCPLPPLSLQQSFAHKIEQIERQKAAVQSTITDLETLLAARMQYWFD